MPTENSGSMLVYLQKAIAVWRRYPFALTLPLVVASWLFLSANSLVQRLSGGLRAGVEFGLFALSCVASYLAYTFLSRVVCDELEGHTPDWTGAIGLCLQSTTLRKGLWLFGRVLIWFTLSLAVGFLFEGVVYAIAAIAHHKLPQGALQRPFIWIALLTLAVCVAKYSFAIPYLALSRGTVPKPISLSIARTKPILRPLILLTICASVVAQVVSELFRMLTLHLTMAPAVRLAWDMLRDTIRSVPYVWLAIALTLIAYQDWLAMRDRIGLQLDDSQAHSN